MRGILVILSVLMAAAPAWCFCPARALSARAVPVSRPTPAPQCPHCPHRAQHDPSAPAPATPLAPEHPCQCCERQPATPPHKETPAADLPLTRLPALQPLPHYPSPCGPVLTLGQQSEWAGIDPLSAALEQRHCLRC